MWNLNWERQSEAIQVERVTIATQVERVTIAAQLERVTIFHRQTGKDLGNPVFTPPLTTPHNTVCRKGN